MIQIPYTLYWVAIVIVATAIWAAYRAGWNVGCRDGVARVKRAEKSLRDLSDESRQMWMRIAAINGEHCATLSAELEAEREAHKAAKAKLAEIDNNPLLSFLRILGEATKKSENTTTKPTAE